MKPGRKVRVVATARQIFGGRMYEVGERFEVQQQEALDLIALNFARLVERPHNSYLRRGQKKQQRDNGNGAK